MTKNVIQESRMKSYFIDAARQIIKSEGIKALSVRTVAERAGYSYATLYNYFANLRELVFVCVKDFLKEAETFINNEQHPAQQGIKKIESLSIAYCKYFIQYTDIFTLVFLEQVQDVANEKIVNSVNEFFDGIFAADWENCFVNKTISKAKFDEIKSIHKAMLNGMLLLYINRGSSTNYTDFIKQVERNINTLTN